MKHDKIYLIDDESSWKALLPLTFTRPIGELSCAFYTLAERWNMMSGLQAYSVPAADYLRRAFASPEPETGSLAVDSTILATELLSYSIQSLGEHEALADTEGRLIAWHVGCEVEKVQVFTGELLRLSRPYDIFIQCGRAIVDEWNFMAATGVSITPHPTVTVIGPADKLIIEEGATVLGATLNVDEGPIYIAGGAQVMEGATLRGPLYIGPGTHINMGARIYGPCSIGEGCRIGGEVRESVILGYSNKAHEGFLGNAVVGYWCNIGAGTNASNLKNDYTEVKLWNYATRRFERTGLMHCGLVMGDHSKAGINTMLNTGTVVGVGVSLHGTGYPRAFVASFQDGGPQGMTEARPEAVIAVAARMMQRRGRVFTEEDARMLRAIHAMTEGLR